MFGLLLLQIQWDQLPTTNRVQNGGTYSSLQFPSDESNTWWRGGGIFLKRDAATQKCVVESCYFNGCCNMANAPSESDTEPIGGGAIFVQTGSLECEMCYFYLCRARVGSGGAICALGQATISNCNFTKCQCYKPDPFNTVPKPSNPGERTEHYGGGGVYGDSEKVTLSNCIFQECKLNDPETTYSGTGGGVYAKSLECYDCQFISCYSFYMGSGIAFGYTVKHVVGVSLICERCLFDKCSATTKGAVIAYTDANSVAVFRNCTVSECEATYNCPGIDFEGDGSLELDGCVFGSLTAAVDAGALHVIQGQSSTNLRFQIKGCVFNSTSPPNLPSVNIRNVDTVDFEC